MNAIGHEHLPHMGTLEQAGEWENDNHPATYNALCEGATCERTFTLTVWRADLTLGTLAGTWTLDGEDDSEELARG